MWGMFWVSSTRKLGLFTNGTGKCSQLKSYSCNAHWHWHKLGKTSQSLAILQTCLAVPLLQRREGGFLYSISSAYKPHSALLLPPALKYLCFYGITGLPILLPQTINYFTLLGLDSMPSSLILLILCNFPFLYDTTSRAERWLKCNSVASSWLRVKKCPVILPLSHHVRMLEMQPWGDSAASEVITLFCL
jgi:hypothetical protein